MLHKYMKNMQQNNSIMIDINFTPHFHALFEVYVIHDTALILDFELEEISLCFIILYCNTGLNKSLINLNDCITLC